MAAGTIEPGRTTVVVRPSRGLARLRLKELWPYRELAYYFVWRDVKIRYKQTLLGAAWSVIQPFMLMVVFSIFLGHLGKLPSNDIPYPVFTYAGLVPWTLFAAGLASAASSMVSNANVVTKVYFPRLVLPLAAVIAPILDFCIALSLLIVLEIVYGVHPSVSLVFLPALVVLAAAMAFGIGTWLAALNVRYRDFQYVVPFLVQIWMFLTPVAYSGSLVPEKWRALYGLNPMVTVIEGARAGLVGTPGPGLGTIGLSLAVTAVAIVSGMFYFQRVERTFADLI